MRLSTESVMATNHASKFITSAAIGFTFFIAACGDDEAVTNINQTGVDVVASLEELPKCQKDNEGYLVFVKGESSARICVDGKWFATKESVKDTVYMESGDFSCTTKELKDKSGIKIICNGDSIGVVLNGDDGASCAVTEQTDSTVSVKCGEQSMTLNLGSAAGHDSLELDSEKIAVSLDTLSGVSQKGPFLKGSTVYLYELSDGRTLKQTNGNFVSNITSDDGRFRFTTRNLMSQYALIVVDGKYRNEVTGEATNTAIRLQAYTDVLSRKKANVNLLTQLEMNRVYYLVTQEKKRFKVAKHQAQMEILDAFHVDTTGFNKSSEDLNVFGNTEADAALLAISILLQGDSSETALSVLLTEIADDMESDGKWDDSQTRAHLADWAATMDSSVSASSSKLAVFRSHVKDWKLGGGNVPDFEKYIRKFWSKELGLGVCGDKDNAVGTVKQVPNKKSDKYYASSYTATKNKVRFICDDASLFRWRAATDIEKDTYQWDDGEDGQIKTGDVTKTRKYDYDGKIKKWRYATPQEGLLGSCTETRESDLTSNIGKYNDSWYICKNREWVLTNDITVDTQGWEEGSDGDLKKGDSTDAFYKYDEASGTWMTATRNDMILKLQGCTVNRTGEIGKSPTDEGFYVCKNMDWQEAQDIDFSTEGEKCTADSVGKIVSGIVDGGATKSKFYCTANGWVDMREWNWTVAKEARLNPEINYGTMTDSRDKTVYKTVKIGDQVWMAENLNYADSTKTPSLNGKNWCYDNKAENCAVAGRFYTWAAAIDSVKFATDADNPQNCGYGKTCTLPAKVQGICPDGWHLPTQAEWSTLLTAVGGQSMAGKILKSQTGWNDKGYGTDDFGFSALPTGFRNYDGSCPNDGNLAYFWSSSVFNSKEMYLVTLSNSKDAAYLGTSYKDYGFSVRCVMDAPTAP